MKVIVLGATGDMGGRTARELGRTPDVERLTVAGRDFNKARALSESIGGPATPLRVDARDHAALIEAIKGHDVVAGAIGPYYRYEVPLARAAIEAGVPYVSICDDHDAVAAVFALDEEAKAAGVPIVTGAGWTPGLTNILAKKGVSMLDSAKEVHTSWIGSAAEGQGFAVIMHTLHVFSGRVPRFRDGAYTTVRSGSEPTVVPFPAPVGPRKVRHCGHPEVVTMPRLIPGLQEVTLKGALIEPFINALAYAVTRLPLSRSHAAKEAVGRIFKPLLPYLVKIGPRMPAISGVHVEVRGVKEGQPTKVEFAALDRMTTLTALPQVITTLLIGTGTWRPVGVTSLEAHDGPDPDQFLQSLAEMGVTIESSISPL